MYNIHVYVFISISQVIDESHPCFPSKYLKNKPVREFKGDDFLKLAQAEKDGLLNIKISIDMEMYIDKRYVHVCTICTCTCRYAIHTCSYSQECGNSRPTTGHSLDLPDNVLHDWLFPYPCL